MKKSSKSMRIIISPAKKMNTDTDTFESAQAPVFVREAEKLAKWIRGRSLEEMKGVWCCNEKIAQLNYRRFLEMDLHKNLTPALISYEGIQYQYMAPRVFTQKEWNYVQERLRILSGFYGALKPLDGVRPYRLEMQAKIAIGETDNLYDFWGDSLYREIRGAGNQIVNFASKEYSRCIEKYLKPEDVYIICIFGEQKEGKVIQKGTQAKMARGEMVRFMAEKEITETEDMKSFDRLGYRFEEGLSSKEKYVFLKSK